MPSTKLARVAAKPKAKPADQPRPPKPPPALPTGCEALLTRAQVCHALSISLRNLTGMVSSGEFPRPDATIGSRPRWRMESVNAWIRGHCRPPGGSP